MDLDLALAQLARGEDASVDPAELAFHLARDEYPDLDVEAYLSELNGMAREAKRTLRGSLEARVIRLCRCLFHEMGFHGNAQEYYDPRNSYLNQVIDRRTGIPITLSLVAMAVGERAGLPVVGVGLPGHFVAKAVVDGEEVFFDPFHGGRLLTARDCENVVHQVLGEEFQATPDQLRAVSVQALIARMLANLKAIYLKVEDYERAARVMRRLLQIRPQDWRERRALGMTLVQAGQPGQAISQLRAYLSHAADQEDTQDVQQVLDRALAAVGKWN